MAAYTGTARALHWLVAALIVAQYVLAELGERAADADRNLAQLALLANHKSLGMTVLALALVRLGWRWRSGAPALPATMPRWQVGASHLSHTLLYVLLFALPLSGWLMSSASAYSVSWFNLFSFPDLVSPDETLVEVLKTIHELLAKALFVLALLHVLAAIKHLVFDRDGVMGRMTGPIGILVFTLTLGVCVGILSAPARAPRSPDSGQSSAATAPIEGVTTSGAADGSEVSRLPPWPVDPTSSWIRFTAEQAGAEFTGSWPVWEADVRFAPDAPGESSARVVISTSDVDTRDAERDATLQGADWFAVAEFPEAVFFSREIREAEDGSFAASGTLTIRGRGSPVDLTFTFEEANGRRHIDGRATLDRLALGVGTGEWTDTTWVGQAVTVAFRVETTTAEP